MTDGPHVRVVILKSARRRWNQLTPEQRRKVQDVLDGLAAEPGFRHNELRPLKSVRRGFRFRLGVWRILFTLDRRAGILEIFEVNPRVECIPMKAKTGRHTTTLNIVRPDVAGHAGPLTLVDVDLRDRGPDMITVSTDIELPHPPSEAQPARLETTVGSTDVMVMPIASYDAIMEALEDHDAAVSYKRTRGEEAFPLELANRIADGESKIRVFREHRRLTQQALADTIGKSKAYVSEIEAGKKPGSVEVIRRIAEALGVDMDDLV
ncbi:MAG: XRE family transcriptional regulator [Proteobacteria bacterium]|nr:XRE family transcriptional regulator [Pseudomonadota bacterium]MCH8214289.1 XRE family transcriptional regulator [Pseudomonadota bacterium]